MAKEIGIGAVLAGITFLAASGYDITLFLLVAVFAAAMWLIRSTTPMGKRFQIIGGNKQDHRSIKCPSKE